MLDPEKRRRQWTAAEKWQVTLGTVSALVAIIACAGQFAQIL